MKFSLIKNDKSTVVDEVILLLIIVVCLGVGIALIVIKPEFWIVESSTSASFGVLIAMLGIMYIPGLIYRFLHNDKKTK